MIKWLLAFCLFSVVLFCFVGSKISLLVLGQHFRSISQNGNSTTDKLPAKTSKQARYATSFSNDPTSCVSNLHFVDEFEEKKPTMANKEGTHSGKLPELLLFKTNKGLTVYYCDYHGSSN